MLNERERAEVLAELSSIAADAAAVLMTGYRRRDTRVEYKGAIDLVTDFDRASEDLIRARVARALPDIELVAEERGGKATGTRPVIYADPLDGTTNFAHGHPFFAVSLGLIEEGVPTVGVVVAPALGWTHAGGRSLGVMRNGSPYGVSETAVLDRALLATGFPYDRRTTRENNFRAFVDIKRKAQGVRRCGAASLDLCMVSDGTYDGYWERKLSPWDLAAGAALVLEAGGRVTDFTGGTPDVLRGELVATNGRIHDELLAALRESESHDPI